MLCEGIPIDKANYWNTFLWSDYDDGPMILSNEDILMVGLCQNVK